MAIRIPYSANGADVTAQVLQLKEKNPSVALFVSYASDAILFMRTMKSLDYLPTMIIGDSAGFSDPSFLPAVGTISQGLMNRSVWNLAPPGCSVLRDQQDLPGEKRPRDRRCQRRATCRRSSCWRTRINRAGAADPKKIQAALSATDWPESAVFIGYRGVKFDDTGQNVLGATYLTQLQGKDYATVWPEAPGNAKLALADDGVEGVIPGAAQPRGQVASSARTIGASTAPGCAVSDGVARTSRS